ncbi:glycine cleavage system H protein [Candidatus Uabimicrobium amorphum]|uniref:Glycine cleavage system H protein n=2 Tax=Uabimicrobium amorphum TaxID=2596890 RepID=A0A5S9IQJ6_UABAM|nr:glycine cleavage system H protein [Candidatus Uabimicrobium amorphum]
MFLIKIWRWLCFFVQWRGKKNKAKFVVFILHLEFYYIRLLSYDQNKNMPEYISYKKSRFFTRLPTKYIYTPSHFWMCQQQDNTWRIGYTKFALRMLGDIVEYDFDVTQQAKIGVGEVIGWIEGFKAVSDLFSVVNGTFDGRNTDLDEDPSVIYSDPYNKGWLYLAKGEPEAQHFDVQQYVDFLDQIINKMLEEGYEDG